MTDDEQTLEQRLNALEGRMNDIADIAIENDSRLEQHDARLSELTSSVDRMDDTLELLADVRRNTSSRKEQRIAKCLITLRRKANAGDTTLGSLDAEGIVDALSGKIDRTSTYDLMGYIVEAVGDQDVCRKETYGRNDAKNTRVVLDLGNGDVPEQYAGYQLRETMADEVEA